MVSKRLLRIAFAIVVLLSAVQLLSNAIVLADTSSDEFRVGDNVAEPRPNGTVVTQHAAPNNAIVAVGSSGNVIYRNATHDFYFDVDPVSDTHRTVEYTAVDEVTNPNLCVDPPCARQYIERANLSTGEVKVLHTHVTPDLYASEWHDADRLNDTHYIVAGMAHDRVFVVNVSTGLVTWQWSVQSNYSLAGGGKYPTDWVHLNDVERIHDGRFMVSLRNFDQVVFLHQNGTVDEAWTLGSNQDHEILFEQHNPDYIPVEHGGPAVLVSDSENNRIVEYQRTEAGTWRQAWVWQDDRLQWPRDGDRLPNRHTLVTDTHGGRVVEVNEQGEPVWTFEITGPYEAERLGTGDESAGGPSARRANLSSRTIASEDGGVSIRNRIKGPFPNKWVNGVISVLPPWVGLFDLIATLAFVGIGGVWGILEFRWSAYRLRSPLAK